MNKFISFKTRENGEIDLTEYYDLIYEYKNDCLIAGVKYNKTYYQDRDLEPTEDMFSIKLVPLTGVEQGLQISGMLLKKKLKILSFILIIIFSNFELVAFENKILFKVENEIITTIDIYGKSNF